MLGSMVWEAPTCLWEGGREDFPEAFLVDLWLFRIESILF